MATKLKLLGAFFALVGLSFFAAGVFAFTQVQAGSHSLQSFSSAQNVTLSYDDDGVLVDRGTAEGAQNIMNLLQDDWGYNVVSSEMDPNDPLVNTGSEYMYQMALVAYHTLNGSTEVTLTEDVEYNGETFAAGTYDVPTEGKYWADFDRMHPLEGPARANAWSPTAHALIAELGVGSVTASTLTMGYGVSGLLGGLGLIFLVTGGVMFWMAMGSTKLEAKEASSVEMIDEPATA
jgi:hypothetical protein